MASADDRGDLLNEYLDALAGQNDVPDAELDPAVADAARRFFARDDAPPPPPRLAAQIWEGVMNQTAAPERMPSLIVPPAHNGRMQPHSWRSPVPPAGHESRTRRRWEFGQFATAALVLVVLGMIFVVFDTRRSADRDVATAPAGEPKEQTLLTVELPAQVLTPSRVEIDVDVVSVPPGNRSTWRPTCCPGSLVEYVIEGAYTVRAEAAIRVVRADGMSEEVPAGTEVTLEAGDGLISRNETVVEAINLGTTPVTLLNWVMVDDSGTFPKHLLTGWTRIDTDVWSEMTIPERPVTVRFRRVALPPKTELPVPPAGTSQFCVTLPQPNAAGTPVAMDTVFRTNGAVYNRYDQTITAYVVTIELVEDIRQFSDVAGDSSS